MNEIKINLPQNLLKKQAQNFKELEKLIKCKNNQNILVDLYTPFDQKKAERCEKCSKIVVWSHQRHIETGKERLKIKQKTSCHVRFCACCCWDRQRKLSKIVHETLTMLLDEMKLRYLFVTFTIRNPEIKDLRQSINEMQKGFERMVKMHKWKKSILGYCRILEMTKPKKASQQGKLHPHFHALLAVQPSYFSGGSGKYLNTRDYASMWQQALRIDYTPVCDVRIVHPRGAEKGKVTEAESMSDNAMVSAVAEMIKYPMKDTDLKRFTADDFKIIDEQMKKVRAINFGGVLKAMKKKYADLDKVELDAEDMKFWLEIQEIITRYLREIQGFKVLDSRKT